NELWGSRLGERCCAGQVDLDRSAFAQPAHGGHAPSVRLGEVLNDGQAEAGSTVGAGPTCVGAVEALEDAGQMIGGNARAGVAHGPYDPVGRLAGPDLHRAPAGMPERVVVQIGEDLAEGFGVDGEGG